MFVTRKAEFSASHICRVSSLSDAENYELFGEGANPNGHGHNYIVEVTVEGDPDPVTGMVIDLKDLKQILEDEVQRCLGLLGVTRLAELDRSFISTAAPTNPPHVLSAFPLLKIDEYRY